MECSPQRGLAPQLQMAAVGRFSESHVTTKTSNLGSQVPGLQGSRMVPLLWKKMENSGRKNRSVSVKPTVPGARTGAGAL